jgi:sec-independent protein translocase protein TatA
MTLAAPLALFTSPFAWAIVGLVALLLFGKRLPGVARSLGQGINEFKRGLSDAGHEMHTEIEKPSAPVPTVPVERPAAKTEIDKTSV